MKEDERGCKRMKEDERGWQRKSIMNIINIVNNMNVMNLINILNIVNNMNIRNIMNNISSKSKFTSRPQFVPLGPFFQCKYIWKFFMSNNDKYIYLDIHIRAQLTYLDFQLSKNNIKKS